MCQLKWAGWTLIRGLIRANSLACAALFIGAIAAQADEIGGKADGDVSPTINRLVGQAHSTNSPIVGSGLPVAVPFLWEGPYLGLQFGVPIVAPTAAAPNTVTSFMGGIAGGYNFQPFEKLVTGFEADINLTNINRQTTLGAAQGTVKTSGVGTVTGRLGFLPTQNILIYGEAGLAAGAVSSTFGAATSTNIQPGYILGAGAEIAIDEKLTFVGEYNWVDLKDQQLQSGAVTGFDPLRSSQIKAGLKLKF